MFDNELITNVVPGIARRLKSRKLKYASVTPPLKTIKKKTMYGPPKAVSNVVPPSRKRKARLVSSTDDDVDVVKRTKNKKKVVVVEEVYSDYDVEQDVQDISPIKKPTRNWMI